MPAWALLLPLLALLALMQGVLLLLARGLGLRLERAAILLGLVLPLALLLPWLSPRWVLAPTGSLSGQVPGAPLAERTELDLLNDTVFQFLPWELEARHAFKAGRLPLWSDLLGGGSCLLCNPQAGVVSPIAMFARPFPIQHFLLITLALKVLVAFQGTWLLARAVGASRRAALLAGAGFALGGGILAWGLFPHTRVAAWVPWVVAGAIRTARRPRPARIAATALVTGALLLEGHPETSLAGGLLAAFAALALARPLRTLRAKPLGRSAGRRPSGLAGLAAASGAALLGLGLAAPQVLPFLGLLPETARAKETLEDLTLPGEVHLARPASWFFEGRGQFWISPASPEAFGRPYQEPFRGPLSWPDATTPYAGLLVFGGSLAAAFAGRWGARASRAAGVFLAAAGVALLLASYPLPLMRALYLLPPLRVPAYTRLLLIVPLCLAIAGALGLDLLLRRSSGLRPWLGLAVATALSLLASLSLLPFFLWLLLWGSLLAARLGGGGGAAPRRVPLRSGLTRWRVLAAVILPAVALADLLPWARSHLPKGEPGLFYPATPALERIRSELSQGGPWRAVGEDFLAYPDLLPAYGIADVRPHNPMAPADQLAALAAAFDFAPTRVRYFAPFRRPDHPFLDFLNVRVVLSNAYQPAPTGFERLDSGEWEPFRLWRNPDALPRWFLASAADAVPRDRLPGWIAGMTDPRRVALEPEDLARLGLEPGPVAGACEDPAGTAPAARQVGLLGEARPGHLVLALPECADEAAGARLLATSLVDVPGWRASTPSGARLETAAVNGAFLGVGVPADAATVELRFSPPGLPLSGALCGAALLGLAGCLWRAQRGPRRPAALSA